MIDRQALHAALLGFTHPVSDEPMEFVAPPRDELHELIEYLRRSGETASVENEGVISLQKLNLELPDRD